MAEDALPYVTPAVRRRAAELGVDLRTVTGTGAGGRIRPRDVDDAAALHAGQGVSPHAEQAPESTPPVAGRRRTQAFRDRSPHRCITNASDGLLGTDIRTRESVFLPCPARDKGVA